MILILLVTLEIILRIEKKDIKQRNEIIIIVHHHTYSFGDDALE